VGTISPGGARKLAHDLVRKRWLQRVRRGVYLLNPTDRGPDALPDTDPLRLGGQIVAPYYFGYATAAELLGLLPQASNTYYIVTTARAVPAAALRNRFRVIHSMPKHFFGIQLFARRGVTLRISNLEKTLVDCLSRPGLAGGMSGVAHIMALSKPSLDWNRFGSYLNRMGNRQLTMRAGYLAERIRPSIRPPASWIRPRLSRADEQYAPLAPPGPNGRRGARDERWHVVQNISDAVLFAEGEIR
jgi:predicted transcriptional regulator of viral defense system